MTPIDKETYETLRAQAERVMHSQGVNLYPASYLRGIRDAEKFHGIYVPTHDTKQLKNRRKRYEAQTL